MATTLFLHKSHQKPYNNTELGIRGVGVIVVVGLLSVGALVARLMGVVMFVMGSLGVG